ncbi:MAG TPA: DUF4384 domain-containing protein [Candidatus Obscuribacterales bacterium]
MRSLKAFALLGAIFGLSSVPLAATDAGALEPANKEQAAPAREEGPSAADLKKSRDRAIILIPLDEERAKKTLPQPIKRATKAPLKQAALLFHAAPHKAAVKQFVPAKKTGLPAKSDTATAGSAGRPEGRKQVASTSNSTNLQNPAEEAVDSNPIIKVSLNKSGRNPIYKNGEKMQVTVSATQDCNVMIFDFDGMGKLKQLFPNEYQHKTLLRAGETISFGGPESPFEYQVSLPKGQPKVKERIFVYAYPVTEKPLSIALSTVPNSPFRAAEISLAEYRKMVSESKIYFSRPVQAKERDVKILPKAALNKNGFQLASSDNSEEDVSGPNKRELSFIISH